MNGAPDPGRGPMILVLGILGIILCPIIGPIAWILGSGDMKRIAAGQVSLEARPLTQAGMICGIIGTVILLLAFIGGLIALLMTMAIGFRHQ